MIEELKHGIINNAIVSKFDALMSILLMRTARSHYYETKEEFQELEDTLYTICQSFGRPPLASTEYNADVNIGELSPVQKAYLCGKLSGYLNVICTYKHERPSREVLDIGRKYADWLYTLVDSSYVPYDELIHPEVIYNNLVTTFRHGKDLYFKLTPFGRQLALEYKNRPAYTESVND